jgi:hypothetical protein
MAPDDERREIVVRAPSKPVVSPEEKERKSAEKSLEEERFNVLKYSKKVSEYIGLTVLCTGILLITFFAYFASTGQTGGILLSSASASASLVVWGFVGLINIVVGFLLMGRD